ncbi:hypothetical protein DNTS_012305 [Danionella cerebrum]|uniref:Uncharacterized protein n=1 Tax=Danionella cerebrum TaxID=2873325 RepID=A0A553RES0_9TELE|nr:hypothetical protein DNTS_012305 [Danionella translucida]
MHQCGLAELTRFSSSEKHDADSSPLQAGLESSIHQAISAGDGSAPQLQQEVALWPGWQQSPLLLLGCVSVLAVLMLMLLVLFLLASDDLEKTLPSSRELIQQAHEVTIRLESAESLSASCCPGEWSTDNFLSASYPGRRVSFNETTTFKSGKDPEKGRRYTLTEGDFHHLKRARLTHLQSPPHPLEILTIMECESPESVAPAHHTHTMLQPSDGGLWSSGLALPGDSLNFSLNSQSPAHTIALMSRRQSMDEVSTSCSAQIGVFHFLSRLRRHASLDGAMSGESRVSKRRRLFRRQRAASETLEREEAALSDPTPPFLLTRHGTELRRLPEKSHKLSSLDVDAVMELQLDTSVVLQDESISNPAEEGDLSSGAGDEHPVLDQQSVCRDIWSLRASLERNASSDLSDSTRSFQSQEMDDETDGELPFDECTLRKNASESSESERGGDGDSNSRKLHQMDSGYASIEAPCKAPEDLRLFGCASGKTASERRQYFTNSGRKRMVCESLETKLFKEELEEDETVEPLVAKPQPRFRRRDFSIDEKTEALFNEFLRHDPQLDPQGSPSVRHRHQSRIHLRKQWQRNKQYSDPGSGRHSPSLEQQRCHPLRRGESANYPLDSRFHSTLPRIASAADEEADETESVKTESEKGKGSDAEENENNSSNNTSRQPLAVNPKPRLNLTTPALSKTVGSTIVSNLEISKPSYADVSAVDKLEPALTERLYSELRMPREQRESDVRVSRSSPDHES